MIKDRRCKEVIDAFNFKTTITNSAFVLRKSYLKMLFEFEHLYYFQAPLSTFWEKGLKIPFMISLFLILQEDPRLIYMFVLSSQKKH